MSAEASVQDPLLADNPLTSTAQRLFAMLHFSAPKSDKDEKKDGARKAWSTDFENLLVDAHKTADQVFRAVVEEWQSSCGVHVGFKTSDNDMLCQGPTQLGLNGFAGIQDGCSRLRRLLALAATFTVSRSSDPVDFPLARLVDMLTRLFLVVVPSSVNASENLRLNESMSDEETNALWTELPDIHVATLKCVSALCDRLGTSAVPVYAVLLEHVEWLFRRESYNVALRMSAYSAVANILHLVGVGLHRQSVRDLSPLMQVCCKDIVPPSREAKDDTNQLANTHTKRVTTSLNADTLFVVAKAGTEPLNPKNTDLETAALHLLATFLSKVPSRHIPPLLRATLDRTAILRQDKAAIFASCMNPPTHRSGEKSKASLLPLLTRLHPAALETEGLVRPRMPILFVGEQQGSDDEDYEEMHDVPMNQDLQGGSHDHSRRDQHVPEGSEIDLSHSIADTQNGVPKIPTQGHLPAGTDDTSYRPQNDPKDTLHQLSPRKRSSSSDVDGSAPAKRRRAAPLFGVPNIGDDGSTKAPPTEPVVIRNSTEASGKETVVTNHVPGIEEDAMNDDLDGSDDSGEFVIPPLTLASDSEDDEENEEEEREGEIGAAEDEELELDKEDHDEDLQNR
ncbi:MAG: hypothetical protein M1828_001764 [Chrysothrix sp. TS-e1954]|nr:MAG: hypothetical protein M1828_001764 [Chrysothrix sp. TS-e1954]